MYSGSVLARLTLRPLLAAVIITLQGSCQTHRVETTFVDDVEVRLPNCPLDHIEPSSPVVGLFIGINQSSAQPGSTPAHTIAAALMYDTFSSTSGLGAEEEEQEATTREESTLGIAFPPDTRWVRVTRRTSWNGLSDKLHLVSDLRLKPNTTETRGILSVISPQIASGASYAVVDRQRAKPNPGEDEETRSHGEKGFVIVRGRPLEGVSRLLRPYDGDYASGLNRDGTWNFLGSGMPVSKADITSAVHNAIVEATETLNERRAVLLVIYIAAHGFRDASSDEYYMLPGDADIAIPSTWLSEEEFLRPILDFMRAGEPTAKKRALVILDTCRHVHRMDGVVIASPRATPRVQPGLTIVHSTSPGYYAWHYAGSVRVNAHSTVTQPFGFASRLQSDEEANPTMSVFPLAARCSLSAISRDVAEHVDPKDAPVTIPIETWMAATKWALPELLKEDVVARQNDAQQELDVDSHDTGGSAAFSFDPFRGSGPERNWLRCASNERSSEACTAVIESSRETPEHLSTAFNNRGVAYANLGQDIQAISDFGDSIRLLRGDYQAFSNRGRSYYSLGQYESAIADYNESLHLKPDDAPTLSSRGSSYIKLGHLDNAITDFDEALRLQPDLVEALNGRGASYRRLGHYDKAIADYTEALRVNPGDPTVFYNRGRAYFVTGRFTASASDFERASTLDRDDASPLLWLHLALAISGRSDPKAFAAAAAKLANREWPYPIVAFYLGHLTARQLAAEAVRGEFASQQQRDCEVFFHRGEYAVLRSQILKGERILGRAVSKCEEHSVEYISAHAELRRIHEHVHSAR